MSKPFKYYHIVLDGIDKTGKDLVRSYIYYLGKQKFICTARGYMSMVAYSNLNNRGYQYDMSTQTNIVNVLLTVDKEDWLIRCKNTGEKIIDYEKHTAEFRKVFNDLQKAGYEVLLYNTSAMTPYQIAKDIIEILNKIEVEYAKQKHH